MPMSTKCQKNENKMTINVIQHDDRLWYLRLFYDGAFSIAWKNDLDDQNLLLATVPTKEVQLRPLKTQTLWQRQTFGFVNGIESDVSQNVIQTLSTLISLAMALILTPSLSLTHFCKSDNCGISKVTRDSDLICQPTDTDFIILDENPVYANQISEFIQSV
jgi:hypothetical protein